MKAENKYIKQSIERLDIPVSEIDILKENNIITLGELGSYTKTDLKNINLKTEDINKIQIELQLLGLNLKSNL